MTLTEFKYIVSVAREKHFGRASEACFVSQPTLSVAIKKLEDELGVAIFERGSGEISITPVGALIIEQAQKVLDEANVIHEISKIGQDPLSGLLRLGIIHTVAPYILSYLMPVQLKNLPNMPLVLQENFTLRLLELLRSGQIDCAILAEPFQDSGLEIAPLYDEAFEVAVPAGHRFADRKCIHADELKEETMLLLGIGHCFRDHVLQVCPEVSRFSQKQHGIQSAFEGSSLETLKHMVSMGIGITLLPKSAIEGSIVNPNLLRYIPLNDPKPKRRIVLAWRKSYSRVKAIEALIAEIKNSNIPGVQYL